jgi:DinB superfamily
MTELPWFERSLIFGKPKEMLPYFLERLNGTIARMAAKIQHVPEEILSAPFNGKWSIKENIGHLAQVDQLNNGRVQDIIKGVSPMSPSLFELRQNYNAMPTEVLLDFFIKIRQKNIANYGSLSDDQLAKSSLHPRLKVMMTPVDLVWFDAEHDDHHLVKINIILKALWPSN